MRLKALNFWTWLKTHPIAFFNVLAVLALLIGSVGYFVYLSTKKIDVLSSWSIGITEAREFRDVVVDGVNYEHIPVYHPGDSLLFTSESNKTEAANGNTSRMIVCIQTGGFKEREIQLDTLPAVRAVGKSPKRANAIFVPDVTQFEGLPRLCKLVIDIGYDNVVLWRDASEHAETNLFLVEEEELTAADARRLINELEEKIKQLETIGARTSSATTTGPTSFTTTPSTANPEPKTSTNSSPAVTAQQSAPAPSQQADNFIVDAFNGVDDFVRRVLP